MNLRDRSASAGVDTSTPPGRGDAWAVTVIGGLLCGALVAFWFFGVLTDPDPATPESGLLISAMYDPPTSAVEKGFNIGDGQLFAGQATDPLVRRPETVRGPESEQAYRYQRPMYGWVGWVASAGRPGAVAPGLIGATLLSAILLLHVTARWLADRGTDPRWALLVPFLPGVFIGLTWIGPEVLGVALVVIGLHRWLGIGRADPVRPGGASPAVGPDWPAVAAFAAAGLCRETLLLVPFVLFVGAVVAKQRPRAVAAACTAVPYLAWVLFLRVRIGAWPEGSVEGRLSPLPFGGLAEAVGGWATFEFVFAAVLLGGGILALALGRGSGLRGVIAAHLLLAGALGAPVWGRFPDFGRVLLPLGVLSLLVIAPELTRRRALERSGAGEAAGLGREPDEDLASPAPVEASHPAT